MPAPHSFLASGGGQLFKADRKDVKCERICAGNGLKDLLGGPTEKDPVKR